MTDTTIPTPENLQAGMMPGVEAALAAFRRAWAPVVEEMERTAHVVGRVLREHTERSAQRQRVRTMMPALTMQEVLVHGYTPNKEA